MRRRELLTGSLAGALSLAHSSWGTISAQPPPQEGKRMPNELDKIIATFPFERVETKGQQALAVREQLKTTGRGFPVVVGSDEDLVRLMDQLLPPAPGMPQPTVAEILASAGAMRHPDGLRAQRALEEARGREALRRLYEKRPDLSPPKRWVTDSTGKRRELTRAEAIAAMLQEPREPLVGEWPEQPSAMQGLSVANDWYTGQLLQKVHIILIPTDDWTTIPAHLRWGGWNACPQPEYHVAALRSWRDRFGAELVGLRSDTMNLRVARRPQTRAEALELAREQYDYCDDLVEQVAGTLSQLAADLMAHEWWFFWWD
jgi:hypothetical protein